jgi:Uncharacterized conserved protein
MEPVEDLIARLGLKPHPEGGWYREIHRASASVQALQGERSALTTIYYLLAGTQKSRWHVVDSDEVWHFYCGAPLELLTYEPGARTLRRQVLAPPTMSHEPVGIVAAGVWQAARSLGEYSLVGCSVGPGFDFADFRFVAALEDHQPHFAASLAPYAELL